MKILIIDDEQYYQNSYKLALEQDGHEVHVANDGEEGLKLIAKNKYGLIVLDLIMPIMSGLSFLREIQKRIKKEKINIIVLTTLDGNTDREDSLAVGVKEFLIKTETNPQKLVEVVKKYQK